MGLSSRISMKIYEFNNAPDKPLVNLAYANGFLPQTYTRALKPLFADYRVVSIHARPIEEFHFFSDFARTRRGDMMSIDKTPGRDCRRVDGTGTIFEVRSRSGVIL